MSSQVTAAPQPKTMKPCRNYAATGSCHYGAQCRFAHIDKKTSGKNTTDHATAAPASRSKSRMPQALAPEGELFYSSLEAAVGRRCIVAHRLSLAPPSQQPLPPGVCLHRIIPRQCASSQRSSQRLSLPSARNSTELSRGNFELKGNLLAAHQYDFLSVIGSVK